MVPHYVRTASVGKFSLLEFSPSCFFGFVPRSSTLIRPFDHVCVFARSGCRSPNGSQDCRDILNAVPKRNPMIVPTAPVRKITSAWDIWTDQTRNRTSTTVEFCIAKMRPNRSRIPPRISLNLVVMVSWFSLSSWRDAPRTERLRLFKRTVCGSSNSRPGSYPARVSSTRRCAGAPLRIELAHDPNSRGRPRYTLRSVRMWVRARRTHLRDFPSAESRF
jgi:hypothetical protein